MSIKRIRLDGSEQEIPCEQHPPSNEWLAQKLDVDRFDIELVRILDPVAWERGERVAANLVVHERGRKIGLPFNAVASELYWANPISWGASRAELADAPIVGEVLLLTGEHVIK